MKWRKISFNENLLFTKCYQMENLQLFITKRITCWVIARISQKVVFQTLVTRSSSSAGSLLKLGIMQNANRKFLVHNFYPSSSRNTLKSWGNTCDCAQGTISPDNTEGLYQKEFPQWVSNSSMGFFRYLHPVCTLSSAKHSYKLLNCLQIEGD